MKVIRKLESKKMYSTTNQLRDYRETIESLIEAILELQMEVNTLKRQLK